MKLALISLSKEDSLGAGPVGLIRLFDSNVINNQVAIARKWGANRIVLLSPTMHGALLHYVDELKREGLEAEILRNARDLEQYASATGDLLYLGDGILPRKMVRDSLSDVGVDRIYVVANDDKYTDFERVDLNHRWLGIALFKTSRLSDLTEIPDDWDVGSALLRTAVQTGCERELVADAEMSEGAIIQILSNEAATEYGKQSLAKAKPDKSNFLNRFLIWPLSKLVLPRLWKWPNSSDYFNIFSIISAILAAIAGYFQWPVIALALLLLGAIGKKIQRFISIFSPQTRARDFFDAGFSLLSALTLGILVFVESDPSNIWPNLMVLVLMIGIFTRLRLSAPENRFSPIWPDRPLILTALVIAAGFGAFLPGLYGVSLLCLFCLLTGSLDPEKTSENFHKTAN